MTSNETSTLQADPAQTTQLMGVEVWSPVDGTMVRQAAVPSIGAIDQQIGQAHGRVIAGRVDEACLSRMPGVVEITGSDVNALLWPVIDRDQVTSVVVLYVATTVGVKTAIEIWSGKAGRSELCLVDSKYTGLDRFAKLSPHISFPKGSGLPGMTWETNIPQVLEDLGSSPMFMRATGAESEGLGIGYAMPCTSGSSLQAVSLLLSDRTSPIARVFETWLPSQRGGSLRLACHAGAYASAPAIKHASRDLDVPAGDTWIGKAWATRKPEVVCDSTGNSLDRQGAAEDGLTSGIAIPIIVLDDVAAVAVLMW